MPPTTSFSEKPCTVSQYQCFLYWTASPTPLTNTTRKGITFLSPFQQSSLMLSQWDALSGAMHFSVCLMKCPSNLKHNLDLEVLFLKEWSIFPGNSFSLWFWFLWNDWGYACRKVYGWACETGWKLGNSRSSLVHVHIPDMSTIPTKDLLNADIICNRIISTSF